MGVTIYTGNRPRYPLDWQPNQLSESASLLALAFAAVPYADVLLLTGVEHKLIAESVMEEKASIKVIKEIGDWKSAFGHVKGFCEAPPGPGRGFRGNRYPPRIAVSRLPPPAYVRCPVVIMNDVDYWVSGGNSGLFTRTCDHMLIQRINELGKLLEPFGGHLIVMAVIGNEDAQWPEVVVQQRWGWRRRGDIPFDLSGVATFSEPVRPQTAPAESNPKVKVPEWCHAADDDPPASFQYGPITGSQKDLASWLYASGKPDSRNLHAKALNKTIWVRKLNRYHYEVLFKNEKEHERAKERRLKSESQDQSKPTQ